MATNQTTTRTLSWLDESFDDDQERYEFCRVMHEATGSKATSNWVPVMEAIAGRLAEKVLLDG